MIRAATRERQQRDPHVGPNMEPQECCKNNKEVYLYIYIYLYVDLGRYILIVFLLHSWGSLFGVPITSFYTSLLAPP